MPRGTSCGRKSSGNICPRRIVDSLRRPEIAGEIGDVRRTVFFCEGGHLLGNASTNDGGNPRVADAQPEKIRPLAILATAARIVAVTMRAALDKELPSAIHGYVPGRS